MGATPTIGYGNSSVKSNEETPSIASSRETWLAASPLGLGLAGVEGGLSYARRAEDPRPKSRVDPADVLKVFNLQDDALPAVIDRHAKPMPDVHYIGFMPYVHRDLTDRAAAKAAADLGLSPEATAKLRSLLPQRVVEVDDLPGSQDAGHAVWHAMRSPFETMEHYEAARKAYEAKLWDQKNIDGLARLLHARQDSYSKAHTGPRGPREWYGPVVESLFPAGLIWHAVMDLAPSDAVQRKIVEESAELIKTYYKECGGCP